jgi:hypothetical protein
VYLLNWEYSVAGLAKYNPFGNVNVHIRNNAIMKGRPFSSTHIADIITVAD